jgi:hypothetical protein
MIAIYNNTVTGRKMIFVLLYIIIILNSIITVLRRSSDVLVNNLKIYIDRKKTFRRPWSTDSVHIINNNKLLYNYIINVHDDFENINSTTTHVFLQLQYNTLTASHLTYVIITSQYYIARPVFFFFIDPESFNVSAIFIKITLLNSVTRIYISIEFKLTIRRRILLLRRCGSNQTIAI